MFIVTCATESFFFVFQRRARDWAKRRVPSWLWLILVAELFDAPLKNKNNLLETAIYKHGTPPGFGHGYHAGTKSV